MKKILYIIGVALAVASCTKDAGVAAYDDAAVSFSVGGIGDAVDSRATLKDSWVVDDDRLGLYYPAAGYYNVEYKVASVADSKATLEAVDRTIYDRREDTAIDNYFFCAYHPYDADNSLENLVLNIDVSDQSNVVDLLVSDVDAQTGDVEFTFSHALTCVQVAFKTPDYIDCVVADFTDLKVVIGDVATKATYDFDAPDRLEEIDSSEGDVTFINNNNTFTAILVPGDYKGKVMTVSYTYDSTSHEVSYTIPDMDYVAGKIYTYSVIGDIGAELTYEGELAWNETNISQGYTPYFDNWADVAAGSYSGGSGTEDDPFIITDGYELAQLAVDVNAEEMGASSGKYYKVTKDIDLSVWGAQWTPIGKETASFQGNFDGGGHTISGLYIEDVTSEKLGLFGVVLNATISNVNVIGDVSASRKVGGIAGYAYGSTITNCSYSGKGGAFYYVGGIVGYSDNSIITNCYNLAEVSGDSNVGGVVGYADETTIKICYNAGAVSGDSDCGAVLGKLESGTISDCFYDSETSNATVSNLETPKETTYMKSQTFADELTALAATYNKEATIKACEWIYIDGSYPMLNFGEEAISRSAEFDGGTGEIGYPYLISNALQLAKLASDVNAENNYSGKYIKLTADIDLSTLVGEWTPIGGLGYYFKGNFDGDGHTISGLYINNSSSTHQGLFGCVLSATISNVNVSGYVGGQDNVGGIAGSAGSSTITNCSYSGKVSGTGSAAGGLVGYSDSSLTIVNCYNLADVSGVSEVGGVLGNGYGTTIKICYNAGAVTGTGSNVGAVLGKNLSGSTIDICYYDNVKCTASSTNGGTSTAHDVMQGEDFVGELNSAVATYNASTKLVKACDWIYNAGSYPTLDFGSAEFYSGDGTSSYPYTISNATQLATLASTINDPVYNSQYLNKSFKLIADIDLSILGVDWTPIGVNAETPFTGTFYGDNHTISGLYISTSESYQGLFGYVYGATIEYVKVTGYVSGGDYVGGVVGYAEAGANITGCTFSGTVMGTGNYDDIVGYQETN